MSVSATPFKPPKPKDLSRKNLLKSIFDSEAPEAFVKELPAQAIYHAIKYSGLESSVDLVEMISQDDCRLLLDFDLWRGDRFDEDNFWRWLEISDQKENLKVLQQITNSLDLKMIGALIGKYVESIIQEEPTETPPEEGFYTPDKGFTWISINLEDGRKHYLFGRLLAFIFEANPDLFYRLLNISTLETFSALEETAYEERSKRLTSEGLPTLEVAHEIHAPLPFYAIEKELKLEKGAPHTYTPTEMQPIYSLIFYEVVPKALSDLIANHINSLDFAIEYTNLINAGIIKYSVDFSETEALNDLVSNINSRLNNALVDLAERGHKDSDEIYKSLGLTKIYQYGLALEATPKHP